MAKAGNKSLSVVRETPPSARQFDQPAGPPLTVVQRKVYFDWGDLWQDQMRGKQVADWTDEEVMGFIDFMLTGAPMAEVCREHSVSYLSFIRRVNKDKNLKAYYQAAQEESIHAYADLMMRVAIEVEDTRRGALIIDVMQWTAERRNKIYQARSDRNLSASVNVGVEYRITMPKRRKDAGDDNDES